MADRYPSFCRDIGYFFTYLIGFLEELFLLVILSRRKSEVKKEELIETKINYQFE